MGCFGGGSARTSSTSTPSMPGWMSDAMQGQTQRANSLANTGFVPYGGQMTAPITDTQKAAMWGTQGLAGTNVMAGANNGSISGMDLSGYLNPYTQRVIDAMYADVDHDTAQALQRQTGTATQQAGFGGFGDRSAVAAAELQGQAGRTKATLGAQLNAQNVQNAQGLASADLNRIIGANTQNAAIAGQAYNNLFTMGSQEQATAQANSDAQYSEFMRQLNDPYQKLAFANGVATGTAPFFTSVQTTNRGAAPSGLGSLIGLGQLGLGAYGTFAKANGGIVGYAAGGDVDDDAEEMFSPSDPRLMAALKMLEDWDDDGDVDLPMGGIAGYAGGGSVMHNDLGVPPELMPLYERAAREHGVPLWALLAKDKQESDFGRHPNTGSGGIGQITEATARQPGFGVAPIDPSQRGDPATNIDFGARYMRGRAGDADLDTPQGIARAFTGYNGGGDPNYLRHVARYAPPEMRNQLAALAPPVAGQRGGGGGIAAQQGAGAPPVVSRQETGGADFDSRVLDMLRDPTDGPEPEGLGFWERMSYRLNDPKRSFARFLLNSGLQTLAYASPHAVNMIGAGMAGGLAGAQQEQVDRAATQSARMTAGARLIQQHRLGNNRAGGVDPIERIHARLRELEAAGQTNSPEYVDLKRRAGKLAGGEEGGLTAGQRSSAVASSRSTAREMAGRYWFASPEEEDQWIAAKADELYRNQITAAGGEAPAGEPQQYRGRAPRLRTEVPTGSEPDWENGGTRVRPESVSLTDAERKDLRESGTTLRTLRDLRDRFEDSFSGQRVAGIPYGGAANWVGRNTGISDDLTKQAEWWRDFASMNNIVRNALFGATLTKGEQEAWDQATTGIGQRPELVRSFLDREIGRLESAALRYGRSMTVAGKRTAEIEEAAGLPRGFLGDARNGRPAPREDATPSRTKPDNPKPGDTWVEGNFEYRMNRDGTVDRRPVGGR